jgi:hypothetical protein
MNMTNSQIAALRTESATAGDHAQVLICDLATGDVSSDVDLRTLRIATFISQADIRRIATMTREDALSECAEAIESALAQQ